MGKSFKDQLLALGLVNDKQVKEVKKEQHRKKKQQVGRAAAVVDENLLLAREKAEKKRARDRELNLAREEKLRQRADQARIRQLVDEHRLTLPAEGQAYRFPVQGKIHRIFVSGEIIQGLGEGRLGIIAVDQQFALVPREIAEKIREIDQQSCVSLNSPAEKKRADPDDPYAAYQVPDDLMW
jgi:uncharacterized protein